MYGGSMATYVSMAKGEPPMVNCRLATTNRPSRDTRTYDGRPQSDMGDQDPQGFNRSPQPWGFCNVHWQAYMAATLATHLRNAY